MQAIPAAALLREVLRRSLEIAGPGAWSTCLFCIFRS